MAGKGRGKKQVQKAGLRGQRSSRRTAGRMLWKEWSTGPRGQREEVTSVWALRRMLGIGQRSSYAKWMTPGEAEAKDPERRAPWSASLRTELLQGHGDIGRRQVTPDPGWTEG